MNDPLPNNDALAQMISDLQQRVYALEAARQPYVGDWYDFNPADFTYSSATVVNVDSSALDLLNLLDSGYKIRMKQTGDPNYRYFYVLYKTATTIILVGGDNYVVANLAITEIAFSTLPDPSGWPLASSFFYANQATKMIPQGGVGSATDGACKVYFQVNNGRVELYFENTTTLNTSGNAISTYVSATIPSQLRAPSGLAADQDAFPGIALGYTDNNAWSPVGNSTLWFASTTAVPSLPWPTYVTLRPVQFGSYKFGNAAGSSSMNINGWFNYELLA